MTQPVPPGTYVPPGWAGPKPKPQGPAPVNPYQDPGSDLYDWYSVNDALRQAGLEGWQIAGANHSPVNTGSWQENPNWSKTGIPSVDSKANAGQQQYVWRPSTTSVIGVINPQTGQMLKLTLGGGPPDPDKRGASPYSWTVLGRDDQGKLNPAQAGYSSVQRLPFS